MFGKKDTLTDFLRESNAIEEVYDKESLKNAKKAWNYVVDKKFLNKKVILETHRILMQGKLSGDDLGKYRKCRVWVGGYEGLHFPFVPMRMMEWYEKMNGVKADKDIKLLHVKFEKIHPFIDGNGRAGRIFLNWARVKNGLPILVLWERERQKYYQWFKEEEE